jgi:hypothetical protein
MLGHPVCYTGVMEGSWVMLGCSVGRPFVHHLVVITPPYHEFDAGGVGRMAIMPSFVHHRFLIL